MEKIISFLKDLWEIIFFSMTNKNDAVPEVLPIPPTPESQTTPITQNTPKQSLLEVFCLGIKSREGYIAPCPQYPRGTPAWRNNNPGNVRYSPVGYARIYGKVDTDLSGFAIFKDYDTGWLYLQNLVKDKIKKNPTWTFLDFFKNYAPSSDGNDPLSYANEVCAKVGLPVNSKIALLLE